jgi:hypothetical protein
MRNITARAMEMVNPTARTGAKAKNLINHKFNVEPVSAGGSGRGATQPTNA